MPVHAGNRQSRTASGISRAALAALVAVLGCQPSVTTQKLRSDAVLFDVFHINYAWGFSCRGCYIDASGAVRSYDCSALRDTLRSAEWRGREEELLKRRFAMSGSVLCRVDEVELKAKRALVDKALRIPPLREEHTASDAGASSFRAFLYASENGDPTEVLLATDGDFSREPSTDEAKQLVEWLNRKCVCEDSVLTR